MRTELTIEQKNKVYLNRRAILEQCNEREFYVMFGALKLPAKIAGAKLEYPCVYSGNYKAEITWRLAERIASGEVKTIA